LNLFYAGLSTNVPQGYGPTIDSIDGGVVNVYDPSNNIEANLDLQYAIGLGTDKPYFHVVIVFAD
jgi:hypothetical protein